MGGENFALHIEALKFERSALFEDAYQKLISGISCQSDILEGGARISLLMMQIFFDISLCC
jgi:hypothetical protein